MKFGLVDLDEAEGAILAHSLRVQDKRLPKGLVLSKVEIDLLRNAEISHVTVARTDTDEIDENQAAKIIGETLHAKGLHTTEPVAGRVNLVADRAGVLTLNTNAILEMNRVDEALTLATLPNYARVHKGTLLATIKVIPYGVKSNSIEEMTKHAVKEIFQIHAFKEKTVDLILTLSEGFKDSLLKKGEEAVRNRIAPLGLSVRNCVMATHRMNEVSAAIKSSDADLVLILGASATSDREDVIPAAINMAGGDVTRFGMPVDPGNLLILGCRGNTQIVGLPGCARAPALNGVDWVLERIAAGLDVEHDDIASMGVGGLLKEIPQRIHPRSKAVALNGPKVGLLLAAGASSRMRGEDKLLRDIDGVTLLRRSALAMLNSKVEEVFVTIKTDGQTHRDALAGLPITIIEVSDAATGMSASIRAGMATIPTSTSAIMLGLADMPDITSEHYNLILENHDTSKNRLIICPLAPSGKRGHPVLFDAHFKENLSTIEGDQGARDILQAVPDLICEVEMPDDAVIRDLDTPEEWDKWLDARRKRRVDHFHTRNNRQET